MHYQGDHRDVLEHLPAPGGPARARRSRRARVHRQRRPCRPGPRPFADELVPVTVRGRKADTVVGVDEHIRPDTTLEKLAAPRPILGRHDEAATVTAGNASGQNDGPRSASWPPPSAPRRWGCDRWCGWSPGAWPVSAPRPRGSGRRRPPRPPWPRAGLGLDDLEVIELNEAFAYQVLAVTRQWGIDRVGDDRVNPNGSGISLGHSSGPPACASSPRWPARWTAAAPATAWKPCASAVARAWLPSSSGSPEQPGAHRVRTTLRTRSSRRPGRPEPDTGS